MRRTDDRIRELARRQRRGLRHGRRRQRASEPHAASGEGCPPCLVARRTEDRLCQPAGRQIGDLRHERRREREAEPHAGSESDDNPTWSPDGRRIAFLRGRLYSNNPGGLGVHRFYGYDLYVVNADGSGLRRLTRNSAGVSISAGLVTGRADDLLRALPRQHRWERARRLPYIPLTAVWSPDGRRIAFFQG